MCTILPAQVAELSALPGFNLQKLNFGLTEKDFCMLYPNATKGPSDADAQQYWVMQGSLYRLDFQSGKLSSVTASFPKMTSKEQLQQTDLINQGMTNRFGSPEVLKAAKLLPHKGVAVMNAFVYDLSAFAPKTKAILESSELELALTIVDTGLRSMNRMFFPNDQLLAEVNKDVTQPKTYLEPSAYVDYVRSLAVEMVPKEQLPSAHHKDGKEPSAIVSDKHSWLGWMVVIVIAVGGIFMVMRKSSKYSGLCGQFVFSRRLQFEI